jgi:poly(ADP-ribose) glycohydrolase ARH3
MPASMGEALTGCLLGQALGDALGFVVEAESPDVSGEYVRGCLLAGRPGDRCHPHFPFGQYTDDTQLTRELLLSFREAGGWEPAAFARRIAALFRDFRAVGAGPGTRSAAVRLSTGVPWEVAGRPAPYAGNGSAMRAAPVGILFRDDPERMVCAAREQSRITHHDSRCAAGSIVVAGATALAAAGTPIAPPEFLRQITAWAEEADGNFAQALGRLGGWLDLAPEDAARQLHRSGLDAEYAGRWRGISAFVVPSVIWSLYSFLHSPEDYWTTICTAIAVGGDTDTMAAIAGAISGARLGPGALPNDLLSRLTDRGEWGATELTDLAFECARLASPS